MTEAILLVVIIALCGLIGWMDYNNRKERKSLLNALQAKTPADYISAEMADNIKTEITQDSLPDLVSESELSESEFEKANA